MTNAISVLKNNILAQMVHQLEELAEESKSQAKTAYQKHVAAAKTMGCLWLKKRKKEVVE